MGEIAIEIFFHHVLDTLLDLARNASPISMFLPEIRSAIAPSDHRLLDRSGTLESADRPSQRTGIEPSHGER